MADLFERKLIDLVKNHRCLYHNKFRSTKNVDERMVIWEQIAKQLRKPVSVCRTRWRSLRDRFVKEHKKRKEGSKDSKYEGWEYYNDLMFLATSVGNKRRLFHIETENFCDVPLTKDGFSYDEIELEDTTVPKIDTSESQDFTSVVIPIEESNQTDESEKRLSRKRQFSVDVKPFIRIKNPRTTQETREPDDAENPSELFEKFLTTINANINTLKEKGENELFLDCIGKKMENLSTEAKLRVQLKIFTAVMEELLAK